MNTLKKMTSYLLIVSLFMPLFLVQGTAVAASDIYSYMSIFPERTAMTVYLN